MHEFVTYLLALFVFPNVGQMQGEMQGEMQGAIQRALDAAQIPGIVAKALEIGRSDTALTHGIGSDEAVPTDPADGIRTLMEVAPPGVPMPSMTSAMTSALISTRSKRLVVVPVDSVFRCADAPPASSSCRMVRDGHFLSIRRAALNDGATELTVWVSRSSLVSGHFEGVTLELIFARDASGMWHFLKKSPTYRFSS